MADSDENTPAESDNPAAKGGPWSLIAIVAIVTVVAIFLVPGEEEQPAPPDLPMAPSTEKSLLSETAEQATAPEEMLDNEQSAAEPTAPLPPGAAARKLIQDLRDNPPLELDKAFEAASQHQSEGRLDDAYLLFFFAAREGHGPAALVLAKQLDPAHFSTEGLFERADEMQAHKWYKLASNSGLSEATEALADLRQRVENAAADGDDHARRIMLQWK